MCAIEVVKCASVLRDSQVATCKQDKSAGLECGLFACVCCARRVCDARKRRHLGRRGAPRLPWQLRLL